MGRRFLPHALVLQAGPHNLAKRLWRRRSQGARAQAMNNLPLVIPRMSARRPTIAARRLTTSLLASSTTTNSTVASQLPLVFRKHARSAMPQQESMAPRTAKPIAFSVGASPAACRAPSPLRGFLPHALVLQAGPHNLARRLWRRRSQGARAQAMNNLPLVIPRMSARRPTIAARRLTTSLPASSTTTNSTVASQLPLVFRQHARSAMPQQESMAPRIAKPIAFSVGASPAACRAPSPLRRFLPHALVLQAGPHNLVRR